MSLLINPYRFSTGGGAALVSDTISVDLSTATDADLTVDVEDWDRIVVRSSNLINSGGNPGLWYSYPGGVKQNATDSYYWQNCNQNSDNNSKYTGGVIATGQVSGQRTQILGEIWGFDSSQNVCSWFNSGQSSTNTNADHASQGRINGYATITKIQVLDAAFWSSGTVYIDRIKDGTVVKGDHNFATGSLNTPYNFTTTGSPDFFYHNQTNTDCPGTSSSLGFELSDDSFATTESNIYSDSNLTYNVSLWRNYGSTHTFGNKVNRDTTNVRYVTHSAVGFNGARQAWHGHQGDGTRAYSLPATSGLTNALTGIRFESNNVSNPFTTGRMSYQYGSWAAQTESTGTASAASDISLTSISGYHEAVIAIPSFSQGSGNCVVQVDVGSGWETTNADYRNSYWYEAAAAGNNTSTWPGGAIVNAGTSNRVSGRVFGLNAPGPVMGINYALISSANTEIVSRVWAFEGNIVDPVVGIRVIPSSGSITGTYSLQAGEYA